jgi:hypothetical protein
LRGFVEEKKIDCDFTLCEKLNLPKYSLFALEVILKNENISNNTSL